MFLEISQNSQESNCARDSFLIKLQINRVPQRCVFKGGNPSKLRHYKPISVLAFFSKIFKRIYKIPPKNKIR